MWGDVVIGAVLCAESVAASVVLAVVAHHVREPDAAPLLPLTDADAARRGVVGVLVAGALAGEGVRLLAGARALWVAAELCAALALLAAAELCAAACERTAAARATAAALATAQGQLRAAQDALQTAREAHRRDAATVRAQAAGQQREYFRVLDENAALRDELTRKTAHAKKND